MENNLLVNYCKTIDSKKYCKIQKAVGLIPLALCGTGIALDQVFPGANMVVSPLVYVSGVGILSFFYKFDGRMYTTDVMEVKKVYDELVNNYANLNKELDLNNPVEIYSLYMYLYSNGYLSKDHKFEFDNTKRINIPNIMGVEVLRGKGVCRHISSLLTDTFNKIGIDSSTICMYNYNYDIMEKDLNYPKYSKEELIHWAKEYIADESNLKYVLDSIENSEKFKDFIIVTSKFEGGLNPLYMVVGNHAITYAFKDDKNYFLDPTQEVTYRMNPKDNKLYSASLVGTYKNGFSKAFNENKELYNKNKERISEYGSISYEEEQEHIRNIYKLIPSNYDLFNKFYEDNKEIYNEVDSMVLKLK